MYALVDCNNFYASCERAFRPDLNNKPIVVLSNNDGCVIARSREAKELGIPMGAPAFKNEELFKRNGVHVFSANFPLYGDMSHRVMSILSEYTPEIEIYSIDEAFMQMKGMERLDLYEYFIEIRKKVLKWTGIPISIGVAKTKALSKVANRIAKKFPDRTKGVYIIDDEIKREKALKWLDIGDVWGVGRRHAKRLKAININTAYDFTELPDTYVKKYMTVVGLRLKRDLLGFPTIAMEEAKVKQNIATTRSFEKDYTELLELKERVSTFAVVCAEKLRDQNSCCNSIMVFIHTNGFRPELPQYSKNIVIKLPFPTNSSIELSKFANQALEKIFRDGYHYKKAGVIVLDITPDNPKQIALFDNSNPKHVPLMKAMDFINNKHGQHSLKLASQDPARLWKMKQEKLSPRYTTDLNDIIKIKV